MHTNGVADHKMPFAKFKFNYHPRADNVSDCITCMRTQNQLTTVASYREDVS